MGMTHVPWRIPWRTVSCGRDPMQEQGKSVRYLPPEEEGAAEKTCGELATIPILSNPVMLCEVQVKKMEVKLNLGRIEDRGRCFKICFYFSLFYSDLTGNKVISLNQVSFDDVMGIAACPYSYPQAFCSIFCPLFS